MNERRIRFFDTTLRDGEQTPGVTLNIREKCRIARQLELLGVDVIEAGFAAASKGDFDAVRAVAEQSGGEVTIASLARAVRGDVDAAWGAVRAAKRPRIHIFIATSDVHMRYKLRMTPEQVLEAAVDSVRYARGLCGDVEFSAEDAGRSRPEFLCRVLEAVIGAGADVVNIPDTVGYNTPVEFGALIRQVAERVPGIGDRAEISVHCHDDLGLAVANSLAAVVNGATQIECTVNGLGERAGNAALEEIVMGLTTRRDFYGATHRIDTAQLFPTSRMVAAITGLDIPPNKAVVGDNAFAHESGIHQHGVLANHKTYEIMTPESVGMATSRMVLGKLSGSHAFAQRLSELGYHPSEEDLAAAFVRFKELADRKKEIGDRDIEALMSEQGVSVEEVYRFDSFQITSGNRLTATATVTIITGGRAVTEAATGSGPVDAAFNAVDRVVGREMELESYDIKAATEGKDAIGEVTVKVHSGERSVIGRGVSTDVIEASIRAYVNAANKCV